MNKDLQAPGKKCQTLLDSKRVSLHWYKAADFSQQMPEQRQRPSPRCCELQLAWWRHQPAPGEHEPGHRDLPGTHLRGKRPQNVHRPAFTSHESTSNTNPRGRGRASSCFQELCQTAHMAASPGSWWCSPRPLHNTPYIRQTVKMNHKPGFMSWTYRLMSAQMPGRMFLLSQNHLPPLPMPPQSLVSELSVCDQPPSPPNPLAETGMERNNVLDQRRDTNDLTVRWCIVGTYHIFIVVTIVIGLSCVGVTVSDQIFHGATECTRHWRETMWVNTGEEEQSVCV